MRISDWSSDVCSSDLHVRSLSGLDKANAEGAKLFAENCAACHGDAGTGNRELGAPNLADKIWLYGSSRQAVIETISYAHAGVMPAWGGRSEARRVGKECVSTCRSRWSPYN